MPRVTFTNIDSAADADVTTEPTMLYGYSIRDTSGVANTVYLRNGSGDNTGPIVVAINLTANGAETVTFGAPVRMSDGVRLDLTGAVEGAVFHEDD